MNAIEQLKSVLCGPDGQCCIAGADEDRLIIDRALAALAHLVQPGQEPVCGDLTGAIIIPPKPVPVREESLF